MPAPDPLIDAPVRAKPIGLEQSGQSVLLALLGVFILLGVGFASMPQIHDGAHDTRHGFSFPCH